MGWDSVTPYSANQGSNQPIFSRNAGLNKFSARVDGDTHTHNLLFNAVLGREHTSTPTSETSPSSNDVLPTIPTCLRQVRNPDVEITYAEISDTNMLQAYNACVNSFAIGDRVFIQQQEQQKYFEQFLKQQKETTQKLKQLQTFSGKPTKNRSKIRPASFPSSSRQAKIGSNPEQNTRN